MIDTKTLAAAVAKAAHAFDTHEADLNIADGKLGDGRWPMPDSLDVPAAELVSCSVPSVLAVVPPPDVPRVKPATVMVDPRTAIEWADIAGADEAKAELAEIVEFLRDARKYAAAGAVGPKNRST